MGSFRYIALFIVLIAVCDAKLSLKSPLMGFRGDGSENKCRSLVDLRGGSTGADSSGALSTLDYRFFVAGGLCAALSHGITTPLDVIKTRMQSYPERYTEGVLKAARDIVDQKGLAYLSKGLMPTLVGYGFEGALKFGCYEFFKGASSRPLYLQLALS